MCLQSLQATTSQSAENAYSDPPAISAIARDQNRLVSCQQTVCHLVQDNTCLHNDALAFPKDLTRLLRFAMDELCFAKLLEGLKASGERQYLLLSIRREWQSGGYLEQSVDSNAALRSDCEFIIIGCKQCRLLVHIGLIQYTDICVT